MASLLFSALYWLSLWAVTNLAAVIVGVDLREGSIAWISAAFMLVYYWFTVDTVVPTNKS